MTRHRTTRGGFTLIELLVVIAIIAVLTGMLLGGIQASRRKAQEVQTRAEIGQIAVAVTTLCTKTDWVPSKLVVREDSSTYMTNGLEQDSKAFFARLFKSETFRADFNGDGLFTGVWTLDGNQAFVLALGGYGGIKGFSTNPSNRVDFVTRQDKIGPFYEFKHDRLIPDSAGGSPFPRYVDPYGAPYVYFSSYKRRNGYERYGAGTEGQLGVVGPYWSSVQNNVREHYNPDSFQIISLGYNKRPGPGGQWNPPMAGDGADDIANFHDRLLGYK